jgi:hypothetical protein
VSSCYTLTSGRYAAVRLASAPDKVALHVNHGYLWVTPAANAMAASAGVELCQALRALGLDDEDDADQGVTVRNAQARPGGGALLLKRVTDGERSGHRIVCPTVDPFRAPIPTTTAT